MAQCAKNYGSTAFERIQNPERKVKYGSDDDLKGTFPNLNTPQYSRKTFIWAGQFVKIMCETKVPLLLSQEMSMLVNVTNRTRFTTAKHVGLWPMELLIAREKRPLLPRVLGVNIKKKFTVSLKQMLGSKMV